MNPRSLFPRLLPSSWFSPRRLSWLLLLLALLRAGAAAAQQPTTAPPDTSRISYGEETMPEPLGPPIKPEANGYTRLTRLQVEERELFKIGLNNFGFPDRATRYGLHLAYERKLGTAWSVMGEVSPDIFNYYRRDTVDGRAHTVLTGRVQVAGRYYYNLNRRIRRGRSASNFSANYVGLGLGAGLGKHSHLSPFYNYVNLGKPVRVTGMLQYGLQRRLGQYGFVDFNCGLPILLTPDEDALQLGFRLRFNLRIGLALGR
ncbi:hypothetical protein EJV47_09280 [Hymenobacter gummosus]|uniref:DUF3575 domain-containing protein n=1 Tax=Hymenobacter gummosus TaxID=1776032 RepID=A0A431U5A2_9BACT|nr:hypothetical protein [Hymenobacter gummosus]RTQ50802.1 hypothetical protein EJV47_09280 [Hymenobacter gummosus]